MNRTKNRTPGHMLSNSGLSTRAACRVHVTIFSTGGKFQPVSNFTELHALTLAACSYALLATHIAFSVTYTGKKGSGGRFLYACEIYCIAGSFSYSTNAVHYIKAI